MFKIAYTESKFLGYISQFKNVNKVVNENLSKKLVGIFSNQTDIINNDIESIDKSIETMRLLMEHIKTNKHFGPIRVIEMYTLFDMFEALVKGYSHEAEKSDDAEFIKKVNELVNFYNDEFMPVQKEFMEKHKRPFLTDFFKFGIKYFKKFKNLLKYKLNFK